MGKDLLKAVFKEDELRKKYKNYFVPAGKVLIGESEKNLADVCGVQVESIRVSLNLTDAASATVTLTDIYDLEKHSIKAEVKSKLKLGGTVKIELGYESEYEDVFHGFIYEISMQFGDIPSMQVTAMDVKRLMSDNCREHYAWQEKTCSAIFKKLMETYSAMKLKVEADATAETLESPLVQKGSDLWMVKQLCKIGNRKFVVCGENACFVEKDEGKDQITTLHWGSELLGFSQNACYVNTDIEVWGNLKGSTKKEKVSRTVKSPNIEGTANYKTTSIISMTDIDDKKELDARADEESDSQKERMQAGSGSCIGLPVLIPGRYLGIAGLDGDINGSYYIKSVNHSFGTDGFTTEFTLGGKA